MGRFLRGVLIASTMAAMPVTAYAQLEKTIGLTDAAVPTINLNISASVANEPDMATFSTGVETKAPKARDAIRLNAEKMAKVVVQLKAMGIADKDIQTSSLNLSRDVEYLASGKQRFKGFTASNMVTAKLRDLAKLPDVLDAMVASGATEFNGPTFSLSDDSAASAAARDKAWMQAMELANYHARKAGYGGVRVMNVTELIASSDAGLGYFPAAYAAEAAMDAAKASMPIEAGEVSTSVNLSVTFQMVK